MPEAFDARKASLNIREAITKALRESRELVRTRAIGNLDRVLKRKSGQLASSIYARVRKTQSGGYLQVGTPLHYGRMWEYGFQRSRIPYRRPWLGPAVQTSQAEVVQRIESHVARAIDDQFKNITIDIKLSG